MPARSPTSRSDHAQAYAAPLPSPRPVSARPSPARHASGIVVGQSPLRVWGLPSAVRLQRQLALAGAIADETRATRRVLLRADWVYDDALVRGCSPPKATWPVRRRRHRGRVSVAAAEPATRRRCSTPAARPRARARSARRRSPTVQQRAAQARAAVPDPAERRCPAGDRAARLRQLVQGRHRPGHAVAAAPGALGTRLCATPVSRRTRSPPQPVLVLAAMALSGPATSRSAWWRPADDLPRHRDGKLARGHAALHALGNYYDHLIDLIHRRSGGGPGSSACRPRASRSSMGLVLAVIVAGYILQRVEKASSSPGSSASRCTSGSASTAAFA